MRLPRKVNHALGQADLAQPLVLVIVLIVLVAARSFVRVVEDKLLSECVIVIGQGGAKYGEECELCGNDPGGHLGQAGKGERMSAVKQKPRGAWLLRHPATVGGRFSAASVGRVLSKSPAARWRKDSRARREREKSERDKREAAHPSGRPAAEGRMQTGWVWRLLVALQLQL